MHFHSPSSPGRILSVFALWALSFQVNAGDFLKDIQPVLETTCVRCHNPEKTKGGFQMHTREALLKGGDNGTAIVPGKPDESALVARISHPKEHEDFMPQKGDPLKRMQIKAIREWVEAGAEWPSGVVLKQRAKEKKMASLIPSTAPKSALEASARIDKLLAQENARSNAATKPLAAGPIGDLAFLRKATIDLIGRIPTYKEIQQYRSWPAKKRRVQLVNKLLEEERFAERWTVFYADMLRVRSNLTGGGALLAWLNRSVADGKPYDEMVRELISASGRADRNHALGFILGDDTDPMALAGATAQIFLGVRIQCAQCHDHPFDDWKQKDFYEFAAFFGKTKRINNDFANAVFTTEGKEMAIKWPPEGKEKEGETRRPVQPRFPFEPVAFETRPHYIERLEAKRTRDVAVADGEKADAGPSLDDLLDVEARVKTKSELEKLAILDEAKKESKALKVENDLRYQSKSRNELAERVTDPGNAYFARAFVNRVWAELVGRGFVEPLDNFSDYNANSHPETLEYVAQEFIASGYDLRSLLRLIMHTDAYQRGHLEGEHTVAELQRAEGAFTAAPVRRMVSEVLYDSVVIAGHLTDHKWPAGANVREVERQIRVPIEGEEMKAVAKPAVPDTNTIMSQKMTAMKAMAAGGAYDLEESISLDFDELLKTDEEEDIEMMKKMEDARIEAAKMAAQMRMQAEQNRPSERYRVETLVDKVDDNPKFSSSMRMASPANPSHFLRVFGQPSREGLGEFRDQSPSLRQALMMLNGKVTHEAARVGPLEPIHRYLDGAKADETKAIKFAYMEILTREPAADELADAKAILAGATTPKDGMADLRWALLNCHEFRYIP